MSPTVKCHFVNGIHDREVRVLPLGPDGLPPKRIAFREMLDVERSEGDETEVVTVEHAYTRSSYSAMHGFALYQAEQ